MGCDDRWIRDCRVVRVGDHQYALCSGAWQLVLGLVTGTTFVLRRLIGSVIPA